MKYWILKIIFKALRLVCIKVDSELKKMDSKIPITYRSGSSKYY